MGRIFKAIAVVLVTAGVTWAAGYYAPNGYRYIPQLTTQGSTDYAQIVASERATDSWMARRTVIFGDPGYATLSQAVSTIGSNKVFLVIPSGAGAVAVSGNLTIPSNIVLQVNYGASLAPAGGVTLTIQGPIIAGPYTIFSGAGTISLTGVNSIYGIWWTTPIVSPNGSVSSGAGSTFTATTATPPQVFININGTNSGWSAPVNDTSAQTIGGVKTFSAFPIMPSASPTTDYQPATKKYADDAISTAMAGVTNPEMMKATYVKCIHQETSGAAGGSGTTGSWQLGPLTNKISDFGSLATLSGNRITLPAGTYYAKARQWFNAVNGARIRIYNYTASTPLLVGDSGYTGAGAGVVEVSGYFTLSASQAVELDYYIQVHSSGFDLGVPVSTGDAESYSQVELWKVQ